MASNLIDTTLYNNTFHIVHNPTARGSQPRYLVNGGRKQGVTTILGATLGKDFVSWALDCMEKELLTYPNYIKILPEHIAKAKLASTRKRDFGASTGTIIHAMIENYLNGKQNDEPEEEGARRAFEAFVGWFDRIKPQVINTEQVIYSQLYDYCGTYDALLRIKGKVYLVDWKSTNSSREAPKGVYAEMFIQLGAYYAALMEQRKWELANGGTQLIGIDDIMVVSCRKDGKLDTVTGEQMGLRADECGDKFKKVVELHTFIKKTKEALHGKTV